MVSWPLHADIQIKLVHMYTFAPSGLMWLCVYINPYLFIETPNTLSCHLQSPGWLEPWRKLGVFFFFNQWNIFFFCSKIDLPTLDTSCLVFFSSGLAILLMPSISQAVKPRRGARACVMIDGHWHRHTKFFLTSQIVCHNIGVSSHSSSPFLLVLPFMQAIVHFGLMQLVQCIGNWEGKMGSPNCLCPIVSIPLGILSFPLGKLFVLGICHLKSGGTMQLSNFQSLKLGISSGMETIGHKQLGAPIFPSHFSSFLSMLNETWVRHLIKWHHVHIWCFGGTAWCGKLGLIPANWDVDRVPESWASFNNNNPKYAFLFLYFSLFTCCGPTVMVSRKHIGLVDLSNCYRHLPTRPNIHCYLNMMQWIILHYQNCIGNFCLCIRWPSDKLTHN